MDSASFKVKIFSYFYNAGLRHINTSPQNKLFWLWNMIIRESCRQICKFGTDQIVFIQFGKKALFMNASHSSPIFRVEYPYYDTALIRICNFVKGKFGYLTMIDVGANIGDTVSLITDEVNGKFLCIEAEESYFQLLLMNTKNIPNITCSKSLMSDNCDTINSELVTKSGTAHISESVSFENKNLERTITVDKLLEKYPEFLAANLVKVDKDGYDYKVIRGSKGLFERTRPILFFELAPKYLINIGKEDPISIFKDLLIWGYTSVLVYDNFGIPLAFIDMADKEIISQLLSYAILKNSYYDVLVFHESHKELAIEFDQMEKKFFHEEYDKAHKDHKNS